MGAASLAEGSSGLRSPVGVVKPAPTGRMGVGAAVLVATAPAARAKSDAEIGALVTGTDMVLPVGLLVITPPPAARARSDAEL